MKVSLFTLTMCTIVVFPALAQVPSRLAPQNGQLKYEVKSVTSVRELRDGTVLLADGPGAVVLTGNFVSGTVHAVADVPVGQLTPLAGDSTLITTIGHQWIFLTMARPVGMLGPTNPVVMSTGWVSGADNAGHILGIASIGNDSADVFRVDRNSGARESIARILDAPKLSPTKPRALFTVYEQVCMGLDGWIAILRAKPYRVDWRDPSGTWFRGDSIPTPAALLNDSEKRGYMARRAGAKTPALPETIDNWPESIPPWTVGYPPLLSADGKLVVLRSPTVAAPDTRYDVIDHSGKRVRQIELPANEKIVGFGQTSVYVLVAETSGAKTVVRHPWP